MTETRRWLGHAGNSSDSLADDRNNEPNLRTKKSRGRRSLHLNRTARRKAQGQNVARLRLQKWFEPPGTAAEKVESRLVHSRWLIGRWPWMAADQRSAATNGTVPVYLDDRVSIP